MSPTHESDHWLLLTLAAHGRRLPVLVVVIDNMADFKAAAARCSAARFTTISRHEWKTGKFPISTTAAVDVVKNQLVRFTTGMASFYAADDVDVTPTWMAAGTEAGECLIAIAPPGSLDDFDPAADLFLHEADDKLAALAGERKILGALGKFRVDVFTGRRPTVRR